MVENDISILNVVLFIGLAIAYWIWGNKRIARSKEKMQTKFLTLEEKYNLSDYKCYTNNHPYVWGEVHYLEIKNEIIDSARWMIPVSRMPWPKKASDHCVKVDENKRAIYVVRGYSVFDWSKLRSYQEWLDSEEATVEAIQRYKKAQKNFNN